MHRWTRRARVGAIALAAATAAILTGAAAASPNATAVKPYAVPLGGAYALTPLLSVADRVPETSNPGLDYQMIGIPDGLGAYAAGGGSVLFMNHELVNTVTSEPVVGAPLNRGAFVSKFILDADGDPVSGERAYDTVYQENTLVGPAAQTNNTTPGLGRFCSGSLAGPPDGLDRWIYFTNEEANGPSGTFDPLGGQSVAIFDNELHTLPKLGHFPKENSLVRPGTGNQTVIISSEDGPTTPDSQLYLYVGKKIRRPGASVLARNGLDNGKLYVFASRDPSKDSETTFTSGTIQGKWVEIPNADTLSEAALEAAADAAGAFGFVRIEDGAYNKTNARHFYFDTTGEGPSFGNGLGRLYHLAFQSGNPTGKVTLEVVYNADQVIADGGDTALSPDNLDTSTGYLMVQEDGTSNSRPVMAAKGRDGSIWRFAILPNGSIDAASGTRVVELDPPGRDGTPVGPGVWESSGIIDASGLYGPDTWLFDVQAHPPTAAPAPNTVEDGQLEIIRPA
jgi:uncharacterized protein DUF839